MATLGDVLHLVFSLIQVSASHSLSTYHSPRRISGYAFTISRGHILAVQNARLSGGRPLVRTPKLAPIGWLGLSLHND